MSIEKFFTIVKDGAWHSIDELSRQLAVRPSKLKELSDLLSSHGLLKYETKTNRIRIEPEWKLLLPIEEKPIEPRTAVSNLYTFPEKKHRGSVATDTRPQHRQV